jgi:tRNA (guanine-N7-)-methyltransferase
MTDAPVRIFRNKVHGRRRGHKLRPGQKSLLETSLPVWRLPVEALEQQDPRTLFGRPVDDVWLEIGFGGGEHLAWQAAANRSIGLIGCEVFETGIVTALAHVERQQLDNVRLVTDDARLALEGLPDASLGRAFVLFPDPWPKVRHHKRRMVSPSTLDQLARTLRDGAELRLATDDPPYLRAMLALACVHPDFEWLARRPDDWRVRPDDWPQTRYEAKAIAQGRPPAFLRLIRRSRT